MVQEQNPCGTTYSSGIAVVSKFPIYATKDLSDRLEQSQSKTNPEMPTRFLRHSIKVK